MAEAVKMNILMLNFHSSKNIGDAALLQSALRAMAEYFPGSKLTVSMNDTTSNHGQERVLPSITTWVHSGNAGDEHWKIGRLIWMLPATLIPVWSQRFFKKALFRFTPLGLKGIMKAILEADLVVSAPGGYLYSSGLGISLLVVMYTIALALMADKPVYLLPQSIGPVCHGWEKPLLRRLLEKVRIVMLRESVSMKEVQSYGVRNPRLVLIPDMAFALLKTEKYDGETWLRDHGMSSSAGQPRMGMTVVNWAAQNKIFDGQERYEIACSAAARWFVEQTGGRVIIFPQVWGPSVEQDDRVPARRVLNRLLDLGDSIHLVEDPLPIDLLKAVYGRMDLFIGTRMHSNIFAWSEGVPGIAIGYQHKTRGIAEMAGMGEWVIDIQQVDDKILVTRLEALWQARNHWHEHITEIIPELIRQAEQTGRIIRQDYVSLNHPAS